MPMDMAGGEQSADDPKVYRYESELCDERATTPAGRHHAQTAQSIDEVLVPEKDELVREADGQTCVPGPSSAAGCSTAGTDRQSPAGAASAAANVNCNTSASKTRPQLHQQTTNVPTSVASASAYSSDPARQFLFQQLSPLYRFISGHYPPHLMFGSGGSGGNMILCPAPNYASNGFVGNRLGSPHTASTPFSFSPSFSPSQTPPLQPNVGGQAAFPPYCWVDPKTTDFRYWMQNPRSPLAGMPLFAPMPSALEMWAQLNSARGSPMFPSMMMPDSPNSLAHHLQTSAGGQAHALFSKMSPATGAHPAAMSMQVPTLIPVYPPVVAAGGGANALRFPTPNANAGGVLPSNPLTSMSQIPLPAVTTSVTSVAANLASSSSSSSRSTVENGSDSHPSKMRTERNGSVGDETHVLPASNHLHHRTGSHYTGQAKEKKPAVHIKKPLNAFMLYMKEMRPLIMQEVALKERQSAEINKILGKRWHDLNKEMQQKYYDLAKQERNLHMQKYPGWSARDNYALHKKKKRKKDKAHVLENLEMKKCRARFGVDQQSKWCKHCRRKKRCLWFHEGPDQIGGAGNANGESSGAETAEQSPPCAQVTSTTNGPDAASGNGGLAAETDANSPQSLVSSTTAAASQKRDQRAGVSPANPRKRRYPSGDDEHCEDEDSDSSGDENGDAGSFSSDEDDDDELDMEDDVDDVAEAEKAARWAAEGHVDLDVDVGVGGDETVTPVA